MPQSERLRAYDSRRRSTTGRARCRRMPAREGHRARVALAPARTPHRSPRASPPEVVSKLLYLRQHYHFGPGKIADYLKRFHGVSVATSSVHRILGQHGLTRLPANQKHERTRSAGSATRSPSLATDCSLT
jgi:transposase